MEKKDNKPMEDIRSYSDEIYHVPVIEEKPTPVQKAVKTAKKVGKAVEEKADEYGEAAFKGLGAIIKVIAFIIGFGVIIVSVAVAFLLMSSKSLFITIGIGVIFGGTVIAILLFFPIYGLGHVICQNNEILKRLNSNKRK